LTLSGTGFVDALVYTCNFSRPTSLNESWVTSATRMSDEAVSCPLPGTSAGLLARLHEGGPLFLDLTLRADFPGVAAGSIRPSESTSDIGQARVLVYRPPTIATLWPDLGSTAGGT
jgi:hypothetical protein